MNDKKPLLVVIDDEQGILDVVCRFAQRAGYEALACASGREAIAQLQTRRADLVMVDLRMPDLGGLDVLRAIREIDPRCQAVLMTGYASVETAVEAIKLGASDYLSKPLDFARLETSGLSVNLRPVDISDLVPKVADQMSSILGDRPVMVDVVPAVVAQADPSAVERILVKKAVSIVVI